MEDEYRCDVCKDSGAVKSREALEKFCTCNDKYTIPAEFKHDSFGYFKGKLVAIDYG